MKYRTSAALLVLSLLIPTALHAGFAGTSLYIPVVGRAEGANGAQYYSTLWISNLSATQIANVHVSFFQAGQSNSSPATRDYLLSPQETKRFDNVVQREFSRVGVLGGLRITSDVNVVASARTYELPLGADIREAKGQVFNGIPREQSIALGEKTILQGVSEGGSEDYRYNFGLMEVAGAAVAVRVTLKDPSGTTLGAKNYSLAAYQMSQASVRDIFGSIAATNAFLEAEVVAGSGSVIAYGSQNANGSQDPTGFEMSFRPVTAAAAGVRRGRLPPRR